MNLSKREESLMDYFWCSEKPLTADELEKELSEKGWNHASIFRTIKSLEEKNFINVVGVERHNKQYARLFSPAISQEAYYTNYLLEKRMPNNVLERISAAMLGVGNRGEKKEEVIERLENIIQEMKKEGENVE